MNPAFVFLVIIGAISLWFLLSFTFPWLGKLFKRIWDDTKNNILEDEKEKETDER